MKNRNYFKNSIIQYYLNISLVEQEKTFELSGDQCTKFKVSELIRCNNTQVSKG